MLIDIDRIEEYLNDITTEVYDVKGWSKNKMAIACMICT